MSAEEIAQRSFSGARRGVSEPEVRSFLRRVADEVAAMRQQLQERADRVAELEEKLRNPPPPTEEQLLESLGAETARVLRSAQQAAEDIRTNATDRADKELREAREQADGMRSGAEEAAETRTRQAEETASRREQEAAEAAAALRADAESDAAGMRARASEEAAAEVEAARTQGRDMLAEARAVRERMLADLGRRKAAAQAELEAMRAGRERLLETYRGAQQLLAEATAALTATEPPAAAPGDAGGRPQAAANRAKPAVAGEAAGAGDAEVPDASAPTAGAEATVETDVGFPRGPGAPAEAETPGPTAPGSRPHEGPHPAASRDAAEVFARLRADSGARRPEPGAAPVAEVDITDLAAAGGAGATAPVEIEPSETVPAEIESAVIGSAGTEPPEAGAPEPVEAAHEARPGTGGSDERPAESPHQGRLRHRDTALAPLHRNLARRSKRMLQDEQNSLLDRLRTAGRRVEPGATLTPLPETLGAWSELIRSSVDQAFAGGRASVSDRPVAEPVAAPEDLVAACAAGLVEPLRDRLEAALSGGGSGAPDEDTADDATGRVNARFREWKRQELDGRVGDLLAAAWSRGVYEAVAPGEPLLWVPEESGRCPDCDDNSLQATARGDAFPTGQPFPPAHPGCHCMLVPASAAAADGGDGADAALAATGRPTPA